MLAFVASNLFRQMLWYVGGILQLTFSSIRDKRGLNFSGCHRLFLFTSVDLVISF